MRSSHHWLLFSGAWKLVHDNIKMERQSDNHFFCTSLEPVEARLTGLYFFEKDKINPHVAKIFDDMNASEELHWAKSLLSVLDKKCTPGIEISGSGRMRLFGTKSMQLENWSIIKTAKDKINELTKVSMRWKTGKKRDPLLNCIKKTLFASKSSSFCCTWTAAFRCCSSRLSYLKQKVLNMKISHIV